MKSLCNSSITVSVSINSSSEEESMIMGERNRSSRMAHSSFLIRLAMKISRSRWFTFLRRVFHYQNGSRSELGSNPFNSGTWMIMECTTLLLQVIVILYTLSVSKEERPVFPIRLWVSGYGFACVVSLTMLFWRYNLFYPEDGIEFYDLEQQRNNDESRSLNYYNKCRSSNELFFAIWFVVGNIWVFDSRFGSLHNSPKLHILCVVLLAWNAISYSFPFILFVLLCCCVPLISRFLGYNMNMGYIDRGALDEQISSLPSWRYKETEPGDSAMENQSQECCICLAKYKEKEEMRKLPCSHIFHLNCVDQWLRIISCCPLCKQALDR